MLKNQYDTNFRDKRYLGSVAGKKAAKSKLKYVLVTVQLDAYPDNEIKYSL